MRSSKRCSRPSYGPFAVRISTAHRSLLMNRAILLASILSLAAGAAWVGCGSDETGDSNNDDDGEGGSGGGSTGTGNTTTSSSSTASSASGGPGSGGSGNEGGGGAEIPCNPVTNEPCAAG